MRHGRGTRGSTGALVAALATAMLGCTPAPGPLPPVSARELLRDVCSIPGAAGFQARGSIEVASPECGYAGGLLLFYRHPDSIRVVIQAGLGTTLAELALTGSTGIAYLPHQNQAFELTPASAFVVGNATMYPSLIMRLLGPVESERLGDSIVVSVAARSYLLRAESASGLRTWKIDGRTRRLESEDFTSTERNVEWHRTFEVERGVRAPKSISVRFGDTRTVISLTRIEVTPAWRGNEFRVPLPVDVEIIAPGWE